MAQLAACEDTLSLFTEGIAGRYFHIKATDEFANSRRLIFDSARAAQSSDAIYLPEQVDAPDHSCYRVLVMEQIGLRECDTFSFRMERGLELIAELRDRYLEPRGTSARTGDYQLLFGCFPQSGIAAELFNMLEKARVQGYLLRTYPGLQRHLRAYHDHLLLQEPVDEDPFNCGYRHLWGDPLPNPIWLGLTEVLDQLSRPQTTVYDSVTWLCRLYDGVAANYVIAETGPYGPEEETLTDWMNREQRVEEWEDDLRKLDAQVLAVEMLEAEQLDAERGDTTEGAVREAEVDLKSLADERDTLKRRIDMEKSSVQHALGPDRTAARSYRYDEWDYLQRRYLTHWCRVYEEPLDPDEEDTYALTDAIRRFQPHVQKQLEQIRPTGLQRVSRVPDGDELDLNAIIDARQDIRAGSSPDERFYSRKERMHRDVCAIFLVDLSASTDDPIEPPTPFDWDNYDPEAQENLRDPWLEPEEHVDEEPKRKIIDIQREAMVVMASALEALGDSYGIYGFSGYGKDCVEVYVAKEPSDAFSPRTLQSIAAMKPKRSTRMGPAIRHGTHKLMQSGHAMKVLMIISDGFPQDSDYGPQRGNHDYGVEDTAKALQEAQQKGVETFCVTVDRSGQDYLRRMCPDARYLVIQEMEDLPDQLSKVYAALTGR
jgi:hypothetical protein